MGKKRQPDRKKGPTGAPENSAGTNSRQIGQNKRRKRRSNSTTPNGANSNNDSGRNSQFPGFLSREEHGERKQPINQGKKRGRSQEINSNVNSGRKKNKVVGKKKEACSNQKSVTNTQFEFQSGASVQTVLHWHSPLRHVPYEAEQEMLSVILRWREKERGMMKDQPTFRLKQIRKKCQATGMQLLQALSLRRHHMKMLNPGKPMARLGLGEEIHVREAAALFEDAVSAYLNKCGVKYFSEHEQKEQFYRNKKDGSLMPPTPDFLLKEPVILHENGRSAKTRHSIHWIEVKMFYGASTIPHDNISAVGRVLLTARKYVNLYGPGAMVFSYGCCETLARELLEVGVVALDANPVDMSQLETQQRSWCANKSGEILI